jgi:hypothetical protein
MQPVLWISAVILTCVASTNGRIVDVTSPTTGWTPVTYATNTADPSSDQQTSSSEGDLVGNSTHPSAYTTFGDASTLSLTDGTIAFRVRAAQTRLLPDSKRLYS